MAAGLIIALPGTYLYITGKSIPCAVAGLCKEAPPPSYSPPAEATRGLSIYQSAHPLDLRLNLPISRLADKPAPTFVLRLVHGTKKNIVSYLHATGERLGVDVGAALRFIETHWAHHYPFPRFISVAVTTALPGVFLAFIRNHPNSWAARHQSQIANALHVLALVTVANQRISVQDLLVTAFVMVSFEALQRTLTRPEPERADGETHAIETLLANAHSAIADSEILNINSIKEPECHDDQQSMLAWRDSGLGEDMSDKDLEIERLQALLTAVKTAEKNKEIDLKRTQADLKNARETLTETFNEYSSLRDEMKTIKQTIGRDHQAILYRKDIELFALRKANEQKENYIKDRDVKMDEINRQHKAALGVKDSEVKGLKDRLAHFEFLDSKTTDGETKVESNGNGEHQSAVQVKLLHIKGRNSQETDRVIEEKDLEISRLREDLQAIGQGSETLSRVQSELRRAWDATYDVQAQLNEERYAHVQTKNKLQEAAIRLDEEYKKSQKSSPTRLETIEESDKQELEAMFNAAQEDNLRLYTEHESMDKRLREANARVFTAEQELEAIREQLRLEKSINADMETARPSLVHRVHFQRLEGQLKESRDALEAKDDEIEHLKKVSAAKESQVEDLKNEQEAAKSSQVQLQEEIEVLKKAKVELESTKEQLMLDHERLAQHRARNRNSSAEYTSARSSGATLITDPLSVVITNDNTPLPARPVTITGDGSIQSTPERMRGSPATTPAVTPVADRADTNRVSMISHDVPPAELRDEKQGRRKSLGFKGLMRKMTGRDEKADKTEKGKETKPAQETPRPKTALLPKDKNAPIRPKTSAAPEATLKKAAPSPAEIPRPKTSATPLPAKGTAAERPKTAVMPAKDGAKPRPKSTRYYSSGAVERPKTALEEKEDREYGKFNGKAEKERPKSRGWATS
jgi:hypothetical protein